MKLGTHVRLLSGEFAGQVATLTYRGLDGEGVKLGYHNPDPRDFENTSGNTVADNLPDDWPWYPEVMLRGPYAGQDLPCCPDWELAEDET